MELNTMPSPRRRLLAATLAFSMFIAAHAADGAPAAGVEVDARDVSRGIERVHLVLPVKPGKLTLLYPKWLPGEHSPDGPIGGVSSLIFSAGGQAIAWQRDAENMFAFHLTVPAGVGALDAVFEVDAVPDAGYNNATRTSTESLAIVLWNQLVLYPAGVRSDHLRFAATLQLPAGWRFGTALPRSQGAVDGARFAPV